VRDHILRMNNVAARLKPLNLTIKDGFLIYLIFNSLPKEFKTFEVNYNSMNDKWTLEKFIAMCVQEEEMIKHNNGGVDSVNMVKHHQKRKNFPPMNEDKGKAMSTSSNQSVDKDQCKWCKRKCHYQKNYIEFLKHLNKQGEVLCLHNVLYVPSLSRNLISVSCLDDDGYDCQFDNRQCLILFDNKVAGLAF
jgi:hypothetical protein